MDTEDLGFVHADEMHLRLCKFLGLHHYDDFARPIRDVIEKADKNKDMKINFPEFKVLVGQLPRLLHPIFKLQNALHVFTLTAKEWTKKIEKMGSQRSLLSVFS